MVNWVEKDNFEKIRRLLEISEREQYHKVLLTLQNLNDLSRNPAPYSVPVIPRPLPTEIMEMEHYVTVDLLNLLPDSSSLSREQETETVGRELVIRALPEQPSSVSEDSRPTPQASRQGEGGSRLERLPLANKGYRPASRALKERRGRPGKRDASFKRVVDAVPEVAGGEGPDMQVIVISGSPEMGSNDHPDLENTTLVESRESSPTPAAIQVIHPPEQVPSRTKRPLYTRAECSKPRLPDRLLLNSYHPPRGLSRLMEEVLAPAPEGVQEIIDHWRPFNIGESLVDRLQICTRSSCGFL